ncbi:MAG: hypothetical protein JW746_10920 [Candidatus Krumholzibacteriota bacterium]|nr:hypothetical protein [Candidatus Krumholzibacteriota bacterium]
MKRRANKHRSRDMHSNDTEKRPGPRYSDKFEKDTGKYGAVAVLLNQETEEEYFDELDEK